MSCMSFMVQKCPTSCATSKSASSLKGTSSSGRLAYALSIMRIIGCIAGSLGTLGKRYRGPLRKTFWASHKRRLRPCRPSSLSAGEASVSAAANFHPKAERAVTGTELEIES